MDESLQGRFPVLALEWHPTLNLLLLPVDVKPFSARKAWWVCALGHEWQAAISNRTRKNTGCPFCANKQVLTGFNDLKTQFPVIAAEWSTLNELTADEVSGHSSIDAYWICPLHAEFPYKMRVKHRTVNGLKCSCVNITGRKRVIRGVNDLATTNPELIEMWDGTNTLTPQEVFAGSDKKVYWNCIKRHNWSASIASRAQGSGCPVCANIVILEGYNDLASQSPEIAAQWHSIRNGELTPQQVSKGSSKRVWWECAIGHEWEASVSERQSGRRCPSCTSARVEEGFNDLQFLYPNIAAQWHPTLNDNVTPKQVTAYSGRSAYWICDKDTRHVWKAIISNRTTGNSGCIYCSNRAILSGYNDLATLNVSIANEWHPTLNGAMTPSKILTGSSSQTYYWQCSDKGHVWRATVNDRNWGHGCPSCAAQISISKPECELFDIITKLGLVAQQSVRSILQGLELDIYIPARKFAIEYNGLYWHSEDKGKGQKYHENKWQQCKDAGITLFQISEDDWKTRKEIVIRGLAHRLGVTDKLSSILPDLPLFYTERIGARKCDITILDYSTASEFLTTNHIQGSSNGTHYLGLEDKQGRLRAVLVLSRTGNDGELRIDRYASAGVVSGGFTRLLNHAEKLYKPERWITFADRAISDGGLYDQTGFIVDKIIRPDYMYIVKGQRVHKFNYRLARFKKDPLLIWQEGLSERELAILNKLPRIWDSGKVRYVKDTGY